MTRSSLGRTLSCSCAGYREHGSEGYRLSPSTAAEKELAAGLFVS